MNVAVGQVLELQRTFTQEDYDRCAALTGDDNPIHVDPEFCKTTRFGRTLAHGMLLYGVISGAIAGLDPGRPYQQIDQQLKFPGPTFTGEVMTIRLTVARVERDIMEVDTLISGPDGGPACEGHTTIRWLQVLS